MKKAVILLLLYLPFFVSAQNYGVFNMSDTLFYNFKNTFTNKINITSLIFDSIHVNGADTIAYPTKFAGMVVPYCVDFHVASWIGKKIISSAGYNYLFNQNDDTIKFKMNAVPGETWSLFKLNSGEYLEAICLISDTLTILNSLDSVKVISLLAKDSSGNIIPHNFNNKEFLIGKNTGFIKTYSMLTFPYDTNAYTIVPEITIPTFGEIYNFNVGDTFQFGDYTTPSSGPGSRWTIMYTDRVDYIDSIKYKFNRQKIDYFVYWNPTPHIDSTVTNSHDSTTVYNINDKIFDGVPGKSYLTINAWNNLFNIYEMRIIIDTICGKGKYVFQVERKFDELFFDSITNQYCGYRFYPYTAGYVQNLGIIDLTYNYESSGVYYTTFSSLNYANTLYDTCGILSYIVSNPERTENKVKVQIYPNPFLESFTIEKESTEEMIFQLYSVNGSIIHQQILRRNDDRININLQYAKGIYFYRFITSEGISTGGKLIKTK